MGNLLRQAIFSTLISGTSSLHPLLRTPKNNKSGTIALILTPTHLYAAMMIKLKF
jgi:hypothetical protein